jgi:hypothetical protein
LVHFAYRDASGTAWHRPRPIDRASELQLTGMDGGVGPLGAAAGNSAVLHVGGGTDESGVVRHSSYGEGSWAAQASLALGPAVESVLGVDASSSPGAGLLALAARATVVDEDELTAAIVISWRRIDGHADTDSEALPPIEEVEATPETVVEQEPTPQAAGAPVQPTPTFDLAPVSQGLSWSSFPLIAGGGLAALAVIGLLGIAALVGRLRR